MQSYLDDYTDSDIQLNSGYSDSNNSGSFDNQNELFTWKIKAGATRVYFINVKVDKNGELYLVIKESKTLADGKKDVHRIMIFQKDFKKFVSGMKKALEFINQYSKDNPKPTSAAHNVSESSSTQSSSFGREEQKPDPESKRIESDEDILNPLQDIF